MNTLRPLRSLILCVALIASGCGAPTAAPVVEAPMTPPPPPVLIHLPGIAGEMPIDRRLVRGLIAGGVAPKAEIIDWTGETRGLAALGNVQRNREQAKLLADRLIEIYRADPRTPIVLTAHSGGTGIAVWALEQLPPEVKVDRFLMLASALSPTYDLSRALGHVRGEAFSYYSDMDSLVLQYGTMAFGTIDRLQVPAAGYQGFSQPPTADATQYAKLTQYAYDPAWMSLDNAGDHIGALSPAFAEQVLAPPLIVKQKPTR